MAGIMQRRRKWFPLPKSVVRDPIAQAKEWSGSAVSPTFKTDVSNCAVVSTAQTDVGTYSCTVTPNEGYTWFDGTNVTKTVTWRIIRAYLANPSYDQLEFVGDGETHSPTRLAPLTGVTESGDTSSSVPGDHVITLTPDSNHQWLDGTTSAKTVTWNIGSVTLDFNVPTFVTSSYVYSGSAITPVLNNADKLTATITAQTGAGTYTVAVTPNNGYLWQDGTNVPKNATWTITRAYLSANAPVTTQTSETYTGSLITLSATDNFYTITGNTGTNAGDYMATFTPDNNHCWDNGTYGAKNVSWQIGRARMNSLQPSWSSLTVTFDGGDHTPSIGNADASNIVVNAVSKWQCGTYSASARPDDNHLWSDGSDTVYSASWKIVAWERTSGSGTFTLASERAITIFLKSGSGASSRPSGSVSVTYDADYHIVSGTSTIYNAVSGGANRTATYTVTLQAGTYNYSVGGGGVKSADYDGTASAPSGGGTVSLNNQYPQTGGAGGASSFGTYSVAGGSGGSGNGTASTYTYSDDDYQIDNMVGATVVVRAHSEYSSYVSLSCWGTNGSGGKITISG